MYKKKSSFLFYDYETFGINPSLDKPAQFACIRTDTHLNIIEESKCFYCFPPDDYLPNPNSVLITNITPQYTYQYGCNEYNFSKKIYSLFNKNNTCIIGYNNICFDDEITRNIFYRNFFDPYEWSWKNGNSRWDLLPLVRACFALRPEGIKWPLNDLNLPCFKLSQLTALNNVTHNNAHDATSDVYATIEIAKLIKFKQPKLFKFFFEYRTKNTLYKLINFKNSLPLVYVSHFFGATRSNMSLILPLAWHQNNKNILISIDLLKNSEELIAFCQNSSMEEESIKQLCDLGIVLIYLNRCPMIAPIQVIRPKDVNRLKIDQNLFDKNINLLKKNLWIIKKINCYFSQKSINNDKLNVDLQIYQSFFNTHDKKIINQIKNSKPKLLKNISFNFQDVRLPKLLFQYRARNFFHTLHKNEKKIWLKHCLSCLNEKVLDLYRNEIKSLLKNFSHDVKKTFLLHDLLNYAHEKNKKLNKKYLLLN